MIDQTETDASLSRRTGADKTKRRTAAAVITTALLVASMSAAPARDLNSIAQPAYGVEGYYQTKDRCYYASGVDEIIAKVDRHMRQQHGYVWAAVREEVAPQISMAVNMRRMTEHGPAPSADQMLCDAVAVHISFILTLGMMMLGPDLPGMEDMNRLGGGTGRVK